MKFRINENQKVTLTIKQLKRLIRESIEDERDKVNFEIDDNGTLLTYSGTRMIIEIPEDAIEIADGAFSENTSIKSVVIPSNVKRVGKYAFAYCDELRSVAINEGVESIDEEAFVGCISLKSVTIPASVTEIGDRAFDGCFALKTIFVNNKLQKRMILRGSEDFSSEIIVRE